MKDFIGQVRDTLPHNNPVGTWQHARNILLTKGSKSIANEDGNRFEYLVQGTIIGIIDTNREVVYFHKNEDGIDEIGIVNTNNDIPVYRTILKTNLLNFQLNCPIEGIFVYNYKEELIVSWCDGVYSNSNKPKVLNTTTLPFTLNADKTLANPSEFTNINITPEKKQGNLDITYTANGNLPGYVTYITFSYVLNDNSSIGFFPPSDIAYLGIYANPVEPKGLQLNFTDLDTNYSRLRLGLVFRIEGIEGESSSYKSYQSTIINYDSNSLEILLNSLNNYEEIAEESIIIENTIFEKVNTITKVDNQVHVGNVVLSEDFDFQKYANNLKVVPVEYIDTADSLLDNPKGQDASLLPDEVYSLYIQLHKLDGSYTDAYHIPGRRSEGDEEEDITPSQISSYGLNWTTAETRMKQFHIFNNGNMESMAKPSSGNINPSPVNESNNKMGFWKNEETYPIEDAYDGSVDYSGNPIAGGEDLRGTPIRYHRMPGLDSMYANTLDINGYPVTNATNWEDAQWGLAGRGAYSNPYDDEFIAEDYTRLRKIGIKLTNIEEIIPTEIKNNIQGYRILHVKRTNTNNYVLGNCIGARGTTLTGDAGSPRDEGTFDFYDFGTTSTPLLTATIDWENVKLLGNELFKYRPTLQPTFIKTNYRFQLNNYAETFNNGFTSVIDFTGATKDTLSVPDEDLFSKCYSPLEYLPGNSITNNTLYFTEAISLKLKPNYLSTTIKDSYPEGTSDSIIKSNPFIVRVVLNITMFSYNINCYSGFTSDSLNIIGRSGNITNNEIIKGGDVFNETRGKAYIMANHLVTGDFTAGSDAFSGGFLHVLNKYRGIYSPANCTELYIEPHLKPTDNTSISLDTYNYEFTVEGKESLSTINDITTNLTFDPKSTFVSRFPYRIYKSIKIANESLSIESLSTYLIDDYYELPNDKGEIIALRGAEGILYIQHRFALFVASIKDVLKTGEVDAYLGRGDLFDRPPQEIESDDKGYIGSVSKFASRVFKGAYVTVNQVNGQVFIVKGTQAIEISTIGNKNWFWNNWDNGLAYYYEDVNGEKRRIDNPYISVGHLVGYDKEYDRLLFIKKFYTFIGNPIDVVFDGEFYKRDGVLLDFHDTEEFINDSKTYSFSIEEGKNRWICPHDYYPSVIFYTSNGLYSIINKLTGTNRTSVYKHNDKLTKGLFYGTRFSSYVDLIFNAHSDSSKLLKNITWITDVLNNNNKGNELFKTITHVMIYNNNQCSGIINLKDNHFKLTRNIEGDWNFNDFRDLVVNPINPIINETGEVLSNNINNNKVWYEKSNFISKFIIVRLIIDNVDDDTVYIHQVNVNSIISKR